MHLVTLSFDDGFRKSSLRTAEIYEKLGLPACFNVVATAHRPDWVPPSESQRGVAVGDFVFWNEMQARGHEVMPHGYKHANKRDLPFAEACGLISRCLDVFDAELDGFDRRRAVFNFPFNKATPELVNWLRTQVRASRHAGPGEGLNKLPSRASFEIFTTGFGPANCEHHLDACLATLLAQLEGWLVYNVHGLDEEGWGPIGSAYLERLLERLVAMPTVRVAPTGALLAEEDERAGNPAAAGPSA